MAGISVFVSNPLLLIANDDLETLTIDHQQLSAEYEQMVGSQQYYKSQLDQLTSSYRLEIDQLSNNYQSELSELTSSLSALEMEKTALEQENLRIGAVNQSLDQNFFGLESLLGLPVSEDITEERAQELKVMASQRMFFLNGIPNGKPIDAIRITDGFGRRIHPVLKKRQMHNGIDFKAHIGTPVYATADGVVEFAGFHKASGFGKLIILQHNLGFKTYFAHLNKIKVRSRTFVRKGQLIGYSGNTGVSTGPHLHYEVRHVYSPLNPVPFLDWNMTDFDTLFSEVKDVKWASLQDMYPLNQIKSSPEQQSSPREISSAER